MPDEIRVNENDSIIEVMSSGVLTRKDMENTKAKFLQINAEKAINKVFIDATRLEHCPDTLDIFEFFATQLLGFKIAILFTASSAITDDIFFAETVGSNRGVIVKAFSDENEARLWLGTGVKSTAYS